MHLIFSDQAKTDLKRIAEYIARRSKNRSVGSNFAQKIVDKCKELASIEGKIGIARPELAQGIRSYPFGNYVIFFLYERDIFRVVTIVEGHRDIYALFSA